MNTSLPQDITALLKQWSEGDQEALSNLLVMLYDDLRHLANIHLSKERVDHTLQPTALVHESYFRLMKQQNMQWENRTQFFAMAAQVMRHILVDYARRRNSDKGGCQQYKLTYDDTIEVAIEQDVDLLALDDALTKLAQLNLMHSRIVELRFFGGLSIEETAKVLGVTARTINRNWLLVKAWLYQELRKNNG